MRLVITNLLQNNQTELELEERNYMIGRDVDNDIVLDNFFVSQRHAILRYEKGIVGLKPVGSAPTKVNGQLLANNITYTLQPSDEIEIGQYLITLRERRAAEDRQKQDLEAQAQLNELEKKIHSALLERLDLRKLDPRQLPPAEYRRIVETHLEPLVNENVEKANSEVGDYVARCLIRDAVAARHMNSDKGGPTAALSKATSGRFDQIEREVYRQATKALSEASRRAVETEELEAWVEDHYEEIRFKLMAGFKSELLRHYLTGNILDTVFGFGPLEPLLKLPNITEIMVVQPRLIYIEKNGIIQKTGHQFISDAVALSVIERIVAPLGLRVDRSTPLVDARLPDGSRVNVVIPPIAIRGPSITIRKFSRIPLTMENLVTDKKALTKQVAEFLRTCVVGRKNIIISGGTGAGKTTLLNCLSEYIPHRERIVTIEDSAELQLKQEHVVSLEGRPPNVQGKGGYTIRDLVKNALRMRPDRVIVGECRGGEALDMLQAMNTGHDGSMTTGHANSPADMLRRLETMVLLAAEIPLRAIREQIASAIDVVIQYTRFGDGTRKITQVTEVSQLDPETGELITEDIFRYYYSASESGGVLRHTGYIPTFFQVLMKRVGVSLDMLFDVHEEGEQ